MWLTIFGIGYLIMTLFAAFIFYCACVIGSHADDRAVDEYVLDDGESAFTFDRNKLLEEPIG